MKVGPQTNPIAQSNRPLCPPQAQNSPPQEVTDRLDSSESQGPTLSDRLAKLRVFVRPAIAAASGLAVGVGTTALAATGGWSALAMAVPAALAGAVVGVAVGVINQPKEHGYLAGLGKAIYGVINGAIGATAAAVGSASAIGAVLAGTTGAALATVGAGAIGVVGLGWGLSKLADYLRPRF